MKLVNKLILTPYLKTYLMIIHRLTTNEYNKYNIATTVHIILQTNRLRREGNTKLQCLLVFPLYFSIS